MIICVVCVLCVCCRSSGDPHARIYDFSAAADHARPRILALPQDQQADNKDVTAAEWHPSGNTLVAGSFKGTIRVWNRNGEGWNRGGGWHGCVVLGGVAGVRAAQSR